MARNRASSSATSSSRVGAAVNRAPRTSSATGWSTPSTPPMVASGMAPPPGSGPDRVEVLEQVVGSQLDLLVLPLGRPVDAGDEAGAVHPAEVAVHEGVAGLGLVGGPDGEPQVPGGVLGPRVAVQEGVLVVGPGL